MEGVSRKYLPDIEGDPVTQMMFADELESVVDISARNSFSGQIVQAAEEASSAVRDPSLVGLGLRGIKAGVKFAKRQNAENALQAIDDLLAQ